MGEQTFSRSWGSTPGTGSGWKIFPKHLPIAVKPFEETLVFLASVLLQTFMKRRRLSADTTCGRIKFGERKEVDGLKGVLNKAAVVKLVLSAFALLSIGDENLASAQQIQHAPFDWHWGSWRITVVGNQISVSRHQAKVLTLTPPLGLEFLKGQWRGQMATLKFQGVSGEGTWFLGLTINGLNLVAQNSFKSPTSNVWRLAIVNPNLLRGASSLPASDEWSGVTIFGAVTVNIGGANAQTRWRRTPEGLAAELVYPAETKVLSAQMELRLPPHWLATEQPEGNATVHLIDLVQGEYWGLPLVPEPKLLRWSEESFKFGRQVFIFVADDSFLKAAANLKTYLQTRWLRQVTIRKWSEELPLERGIVFAPYNSPLREKAAKEETILGQDLPTEGYALLASAQGVWIFSSDSEGAFWAVQTLKQLMRLTNDGAVIVPGVLIRDFPDFNFRGVHVVLDDHSLEFHGKLIEQVFAPLKFNKVVMQVDHIKWERHPEIWQPWSVSKESVKELIGKAEASNLEVIPLLPTLSHCEYLFGSLAGGAPKANAEIAEDPTTAYLYCPNLERTYQIVFDLLEELLELFKPRWVHIGHDEVLSRGRFASCIRCQGMPPHFLFAEDVKRLYGFLKSRGVGVMMWGDMLLRPDEAFDAAHGGEPQNFWLARKLIPRDILIVDWHYQPAPRYPSVKALKQEGFEVIGATWRNQQTIVEFTKAAKEAGALGMLQTTWTGFGNNRNALRDFPEQFAAYIVAAEQFWNASKSALSRGYSAWSIFEALWREPKIQPMGGFVVDLSPSANLTIAKLLGVPPQQLLGGKRWLNRRLFWLSSDEKGSLKSVALKGAWLTGAPDEVVVEVNEPALELTFIHATDIPAPENELIGGYEISLEGDRKVTVPLHYGQQIRALTDDQPLRDARASLAWRWRTAKGIVSLNALTIPFGSETTVQKIRFYSTHEEASPLLVAITGASSVSIAEGMP
ncbi:MAG: beta-N-acetylhexosaminidase [Armatimonadetes bacterium]|nr:beta-N-acetylhexosaminidase [Armatimonadota bacterium]MCX7967846.1 beta-N-acetylhexosaminidase [Armatimonadota bacterium]MDW8143700.1 glycoside hydrolase family 20 zincin-like fold domain-containing protein [Armatimonadota bacterium]